jgi:hypothetical protein
MNKFITVYKSLSYLLAGTMLSVLCVVDVAGAQAPRAIEAGTTISVRTTETIDADESDGRVFLGVVDQDVRNRNGTVAIPAGSDVELVVKNISDDELAVDLDAVIVASRRYGIDAEGNTITAEKREGIGVNKRTGKYVGGGALLGAVIGAIAGGGKGAAIGAGAGAAAGAGAQVLTRGRSVNIPAETLLTFRLQQPLRTRSADTSFNRNENQSRLGNADPVSSPAYRAGLQAGRADRDRNLPYEARNSRWTGAQQRRDYEAGYDRGYAETRDNTGVNRGYIRIGRDNNITWEVPEIARIYVQVDNQPRKLFAEGKSGSQGASWIVPGHLYIFIVQDLNGNEIARDRLDLR